MKKKQLLKEIMGVPKALTPWIKSFTEIIIETVKDVIYTQDWDESGKVIYKNEDGEDIEGAAFRKLDILIDGKEVLERVSKLNGFSDVKEFVESDMFKSLPIWRPDIIINLVGSPPDMLKKDNEVGEVQARVGQDINVKLTNLGKQKVMPSVHFIFDIVFSHEGVGEKEKSLLSKVISHELLHVYQAFKQLESGNKSHFGKETLLNVLHGHPITANTGLPYWDYFLNLVYLHLSFEINARVNELYNELKDEDINTVDDFLLELKKTNIWGQMSELENFDAEEYIENFKYPKMKTPEDLEDGENPLELLHNLAIGMDLAKKGVDVRSKNRALKSLIDLWDKTLQIGVKELGKMGVDIPMDKVPKKAKEDPYVFFKFFEDRFHKKSEKWKRKLYRIASLILDKNNPLNENIINEERVVNFNQDNNNFVVVAGGPGVGKSFITNNLINLNNVKYFNVDIVRELTAKKLWGDDWAKNMSTPDGYQKVLDLTHTTSDPRNLTIKFLKNFLQVNRKEGVNVIYDAGGGQREVMEEIWGIAKDNGFNTTLVYVRTPLDVAQERNIERPRSLPSEMVANYHKKVKDNIRYLIEKFDNVWFVDNKDIVDISDRPTENIEQIK